MIIAATEILRDFRTGSSLPALVRGNDDLLYVVKWNGTAEGPVASIADWIASNLARSVGIKVPNTSLIDIQCHLCQCPMDPELKDLVLRSIGTNLAVEYLPEAIPYQESLLRNIDEKLREKIFLLDLLLLNIDRVDINPNMLLVNGDLYCIDFSASLAIRQKLTTHVIAESALLALLRRHPFYSEKNTVSEQSFNIRQDAIRQIIAKVPDEWFREVGSKPADARKKIAEGIINTIQDQEKILQKRLLDLKQIPFQNSDERRELRRKNLENFKARAGL